MKQLVLCFLIVSISVFAKEKTATEKSKEKLTFSQTRIFIPSKGSIATAGYAEVKNNSGKDITLVISKADLFKAVESHMTLEKEGRMAMEKVDKFTIPANGTFELKQGGNHLMFFEPLREIKADEEVNIEFLVDGEKQIVKFKAIPRVSAPKKEDSHHH